MLDSWGKWTFSEADGHKGCDRVGAAATFRQLWMMFTVHEAKNNSPIIRQSIHPSALLESLFGRWWRHILTQDTCPAYLCFYKSFQQLVGFKGGQEKHLSPGLQRSIFSSRAEQCFFSPRPRIHLSIHWSWQRPFHPTWSHTALSNHTVALQRLGLRSSALIKKEITTGIPPWP